MRGRVHTGQLGVGQSCVGCLSLFSRERELLSNKLKEVWCSAGGCSRVNLMQSRDTKKKLVVLCEEVQPRETT